MNVLITGAAGGLGRAFAVECAKRGYNLLLTDINEAGLLSIREGLERRYGSRVLIMPLDITQSAGLEKLFCFAREAGFRIDMLVNVAGGDAEGAFLERDGATIARLVRLNVVAALEATHSALEARNPDIPFYVVFVSSLASMYPMPLKATYAASKRLLALICSTRASARFCRADCSSLPMAAASGGWACRRRWGTSPRRSR